jgi:hypothetical protein
MTTGIFVLAGVACETGDGVEADDWTQAITDTKIPITSIALHKALNNKCTNL